MSDVVCNKSTSLAFRVVLYFARNPEEELTSSDIALKWCEREVKDISGRLRKYRAGGVLNCDTKNKELIWSAGPELLKLIDQ